MEERIWTIFHRSGYTAAYEPVWQKYVCCGGRADMVQQADGNGKARNRLTLRLSAYESRLLDRDGNSLSFREAGISPGDLVTEGMAEVPEDSDCRRIGSVTHETGSGRMCGMVIAAE